LQPSFREIFGEKLDKRTGAEYNFVYRGLRIK